MCQCELFFSIVFAYGKLENFCVLKKHSVVVVVNWYGSISTLIHSTCDVVNTMPLLSCSKSIIDTKNNTRNIIKRSFVAVLNKLIKCDVYPMKIVVDLLWDFNRNLEHLCIPFKMKCFDNFFFEHNRSLCMIRSNYITGVACERILYAWNGKNMFAFSFTQLR